MFINNFFFIMKNRICLSIRNNFTHSYTWILQMSKQGVSFSSLLCVFGFRDQSTDF